MRNKIIFIIIIILSIAVPVVVTCIRYIENREMLGGFDVSNLPAFHAILNGSTAIFLCIGVFFIKKKNIKLHKLFMSLSFIFSSIFLVSYVIYHSKVPPTHFGGEGYIKPIYYFILISHIILATITEPLALITLYRALTNDFGKHKKIARYTFPIWLYVSITGVLVYIFMMPYYKM